MPQNDLVSGEGGLAHSCARAMAPADWFGDGDLNRIGELYVPLVQPYRGEAGEGSTCR